MMKYKVLSTKKLEPSLVVQAGLIGVEIIEQEFISIKPILNDEIQNKIIGFIRESVHVAFTSANAVYAVNRLFLGEEYSAIPWKAFCLSGKTKQALLSQKFSEKNILAEGANATQLAEAIVAHHPPEIIFFCGNRRRDELPDRLKQEGISVTEIVVYETVESPSRINDDFDAVLFFSPSGVQSFFSANTLPKKTACFAFGPTTANRLATFTTNEVITSISGDQHMFVNEVINYFDPKTKA